MAFIGQPGMLKGFLRTQSQQNIQIFYNETQASSQQQVGVSKNIFKPVRLVKHDHVLVFVQIFVKPVVPLTFVGAIQLAIQAIEYKNAAASIYKLESVGVDQRQNIKLPEFETMYNQQFDVWMWQIICQYYNNVNV
ncbi:Hypothetical_protein [Hexamita inflata]|uniref:Hypothetical_protein n=1 Tax=Hexamita inflata TaxID=28002 RepID=A0AA86PPE1_9EUKA|nr:Hypothetical protein HINF_LOCUS30906 [Hexamita inflata]